MDYIARLSSIIAPGTRALVIDDSATTRRIFRSQLESLAIEVAEASDGKEALEYLEREIESTQLVLSDISMPTMDGFEFCYRLQQAPWYDGTPLVMVSTQSDATSVIRVLKLGADDYIPKPFDQEVLAQVIGRVMTHG
ncbi:MAG: response regulator [Candidatus Eisenbacteria sp.]|nr:response regulator [Candidatus Eisenbacteria bacterium]